MFKWISDMFSYRGKWDKEKKEWKEVPYDVKGDGYLECKSSDIVRSKGYRNFWERYNKQ